MLTHGIAQIHMFKDLSQMPSVNLGIEHLDADNQKTIKIYVYFCHHMSHVMRKPVYALCEQQGRRSACATAQSDQRFCCSLPR